MASKQQFMETAVKRGSVVIAVTITIKRKYKPTSYAEDVWWGNQEILGVGNRHDNSILFTVY